MNQLTNGGEQLIEDQSLGKQNRKAGLCNSGVITLMVPFKTYRRI